MTAATFGRLRHTDEPPMPKGPTGPGHGTAPPARLHLAARPEGTTSARPSTPTRDRIVAGALATLMTAGLVVGYSCRPAMAEVGGRAPAQRQAPLPPAAYVGGPVAVALADDPVEFSLLATTAIGGKLRSIPKADRWVISQICRALPDRADKGCDPYLADDSREVVTNDRTHRRFTEVPANASDQ